jgi:predicted outer membrane repeat protein
MRGKANLLTWLMFSAFLLLTAQTVTAGKIIHVDDDATGANNGLSWEDAINSLQDALSAAYFSDGSVEIRVAQGIYTPDIGIGITPGDPNVSFQLINNVTLKGGYAGIKFRSPNARNIEQYETILSGDLNGDDIDVNDLLAVGMLWAENPFWTEPNREDNSYHVVNISGTNDSIVLDGVTIAGGYARYPSSDNGGGMYIDNNSPTVINCKFTRNSAYWHGGGIYCGNNSYPVLMNCIFTLNSADDGGGIYNTDANPILTNCIFHQNLANLNGGGIYNEDSNPMLTNCAFSINTGFHGGAMFNGNSSPTLTNCTFINNTTAYPFGVIVERAQESGGGMYNWSGSSTLINCIFNGNSAHYGGGMYNNESAPVFTNCIFSGNSGHYGGGMSNWESNPILTNCTFSSNSADSVGGITCGGTPVGLVILINCIVWDNVPVTDQISGHIYVFYSDIQGGWPGEGNIDVDPFFANPGYWADADDPNIVVEPNNPNAIWIDGDYHLKSQAGRYDPTSESWIVDDVSSPCIDTGDPNSPVAFEPSPNGGIINMGAYGGTNQASKSYAQE